MKNKGITLVSLVVTIIILIILAGVSINLTLGEDGIFMLAKKAKENTELAQIEEQEKLNALDTQLELNSEGGGETGGNSYDAITKLVAFKREIAKAIQEAGGMPPEDPIVADIETFKERIVGEKGIVAEVTKDATATPEDIAEGKTAYVNGIKINGVANVDSYSNNYCILVCTFGSNQKQEIQGQNFLLSNITFLDQNYIRYDSTNRSILFLKVGTYLVQMKGGLSGNNSGSCLTINLNNSEIGKFNPGSIDFYKEVTVTEINTSLYFTNPRYESLSGPLLITRIK